MEIWAPQSAEETAEAVAAAVAAGTPMELIGFGSKRGLGRPVTAEVTLDLSGLTGVVDYQPEELVLTVNPGTRVAEVEALLEGRRQMLAFEPPDFGPLWGAPTGMGSSGGCVLAGRGGSRRLSAGGPRDHCLGVKAVNGLGAPFGAGGRVVKNVTGFDLTKLVAGSFGTLCAVTELTLKVLPAPEETWTLVLAGLSAEAAVQAMVLALGSPAQVSSAAHLPADVASGSKVAAVAALGASVTLIRLEGVPVSVAARAEHLRGLLAGAPISVLDQAQSKVVWKEISDAAYFAGAGEAVIWKLSVPPMLGPVVAARATEAVGGRAFFDWGGGGVWLELPPAEDAHAAALRAIMRAATRVDGHATLFRAPASVRAAVPPFEPLAPAAEALSRRVQAQFDPDGLFNRGRMYEAG